MREYMMTNKEHVNENKNIGKTDLKSLNMYTEAILWMISWPVLIAVSYLLVRLVVKKYESRLEEEDKG